MSVQRGITTTLLSLPTDTLFLVLELIFIADIAVRFYGLGWLSFTSNGWNIYDLIVVPGAFATTIPILVLGTIQVNQSVLQLQKVRLRRGD